MQPDRFLARSTSAAAATHLPVASQAQVALVLLGHVRCFGLTRFCSSLSSSSLLFLVCVSAAKMKSCTVVLSVLALLFVMSRYSSAS